MKTKMNIVFLAGLLLSLAGCAVTDMDKTADLSRLHTYAWGPSEIKVENPMFRGDLITKKIKGAVDEEFQKKGIRRDDRHPDFLVSFTTYTEKKQSSFSNGSFGYYPMMMPFRYGWYPYPFGYGMMPYGGGANTYNYTQGTLILDITDKATNEVVWRGSVKGNIDQTNNLDKLIRKGIKAIVKKYPANQPQQEIHTGNGPVS